MFKCRYFSLIAIQLSLHTQNSKQPLAFSHGPRIACSNAFTFACRVVITYVLTAVSQEPIWQSDRRMTVSSINRAVSSAPPTRHMHGLVSLHFEPQGGFYYEAAGVTFVSIAIWSYQNKKKRIIRCFRTLLYLCCHRWYLGFSLKHARTVKKS